MKRPGPVGLVILLAFAVPAVIEFRTVLSMVGIDVPARIYFPAAALVVALVVGGVLLWPEAGPEGGEGNPSRR